MSNYGKSKHALMRWALNHKPILGRHYYLIYLQQAKYPCSAQMFSETLRDYYKPSLMGYSAKLKETDYTKFYQKLCLKLYFDHCTYTESLANYQQYVEYAEEIYEEFNYPISLISKNNFRNRKSDFNKMMLKD